MIHISKLVYNTQENKWLIKFKAQHSAFIILFMYNMKRIHTLLKKWPKDTEAYQYLLHSLGVEVTLVNLVYSVKLRQEFFLTMDYGDTLEESLHVEQED